MALRQLWGSGAMAAAADPRTLKGTTSYLLSQRCPHRQRRQRNGTMRLSTVKGTGNTRSGEGAATNTGDRAQPSDLSMLCTLPWRVLQKQIFGDMLLFAGTLHTTFQRADDLRSHLPQTTRSGQPVAPGPFAHLLSLLLGTQLRPHGSSTGMTWTAQPC